MNKYNWLIKSYLLISVFKYIEENAPEILINLEYIIKNIIFVKNDKKDFSQY